MPRKNHLKKRSMKPARKNENAPRQRDLQKYGFFEQDELNLKKRRQ